MLWVRYSIPSSVFSLLVMTSETSSSSLSIRRIFIWNVSSASSTSSALRLFRPWSDTCTPLFVSYSFNHGTLLLLNWSSISQCDISNFKICQKNKEYPRLFRCSPAVSFDFPAIFPQALLSRPN